MTLPIPPDDIEDVDNEPADTELADFDDDPSIPDDPMQPAPATDNAARPEDGEQLPEDPGGVA
jgi:hypothetical protein